MILIVFFFLSFAAYRATDKGILMVHLNALPFLVLVLTFAGVNTVALLVRRWPRQRGLVRC